MSKLVVIRFCVSCPHQSEFFDGDGGNLHCCHPKIRADYQPGKVVENILSIPKWCPLPDVEDEE